MSQNSPLVAEVETVTPALAHELLSTKHRPDRAVVPSHVEKLSDDMRLGFWTLNGESIKINTEGEVIDGQHRLHACILADRPFDTFMVRGLSSKDDVQFTTDNGRKRSVADALRISGESYANELAGAVAHQWRFLTGKMTLTVTPSVPVALKLFARFAGTDEEGLRQSAKEISHLKGQGRVSISGSLSIWAHFVFGEIDRRKKSDPPLNEEFWKGLFLGLDLIEEDPRHHLRNRFIDHANRLKATKSMGRSEMTALMIKAWNHYAGGQTMSTSALRWRQVGPAREPFPLIDDQDVLDDWFRIRL